MFSVFKIPLNILGKEIALAIIVALNKMILIITKKSDSDTDFFGWNIHYV